MTKPVPENARMVIADMPTWYYFIRPQNLSSHNLLTYIKPPPNWRSLLGLGLNFCPRPRYTNFGLKQTQERFTRDIFNKAIYIDNDDANDTFDGTLYIRSNREPDKRRLPMGLPTRIKKYF
jgi:hypothetical protein